MESVGGAVSRSVDSRSVRSTDQSPESFDQVIHAQLLYVRVVLVVSLNALFTFYKARAWK